MRAAFFDLDRALLRSPLETAARRLYRRYTGRPPMTEKEEFGLRLRRQARALIAAHHWRGHVVVLVTDGTPEWAELAARELDADGVLMGWSALSPTRFDAKSEFMPERGRTPERVGDNPLHHWRPSAITKFCLRYNFAAGACFGYGALVDDWLWLETLGHPAVAHPVGQLRRRAQSAGWPVLNLNRRSDLRTPPALSFGSAPPSAPPCVTLT